METNNKRLRTQKGQNVMDLTEDQARAHIEHVRWPDGPVCPHCGSVNVYRLEGKSQRPGLLACRDCRGNFTVTVGTVMEDSHLSLTIWVRAFHFIATSKKGMSALQLQRNLGLGSYKTAWHLAHRIREAMRCEPVAGMLKGPVELDEAYVGGKPRPGTGKHKSGRGTPKAPVFLAVQRDGNAVAQHMPRPDAPTIAKTVKHLVDKSSTLYTDEYVVYKRIGEQFAGGHKTVCHSMGEYVCGDAHTNTAESYFALLKRGVIGTFHHVSKQHLHRYCDEFSFRWNGRKLQDTVRRDLAVKGAEGKRLMYKSPVTPKQEPPHDGEQLPMWPV